MYSYFANVLGSTDAPSRVSEPCLLSRCDDLRPLRGGTATIVDQLAHRDAVPRAQPQPRQLRAPNIPTIALVCLRTTEERPRQRLEHRIVGLAHRPHHLLHNRLGVVQRNRSIQPLDALAQRRLQHHPQQAADRRRRFILSIAIITIIIIIIIIISIIIIIIIIGRRMPG